MANSTVWLVTGSSRGIGLGLVEEVLTTDKGSKVIAACRNPDKAEKLQSLKAEYGERLHLLKLDTSSEASIKEAAATVEKAFPEGIDYLINNAGIQEPKSTPLGTKAADYREVLEVNVIGPFLVTQAFVEQLRKKPTKVIVNTSSILASVKLNNDLKGLNGQYIAYNSSKSCLNMQTSVLAHELRDFRVVALHPGWVQTHMGNKAGNAPLTVKESAEGQIKVIKGLKPGDSGLYYQWDGKTLPY